MEIPEDDFLLRLGRIHFDLDQVGQLDQGIHSRAGPEIVQRDPIPLVAHAANRLQHFLVRLDVFGQLDNGLPGRKAGIQILQKHVPAKVDAAELAAKQLVPTNRQHSVGNYLPRSRTGLGPIEVRGCGVGPEEKLVGPNFAVAVENGLAGDKHFHPLGIGETSSRISI